MIRKGLRQEPKNRHDPLAAEAVLDIAGSYLRNAGRLIYSYGSRTFLSGYNLFDPQRDGRGNIDCSTFVLLVLAGIPYEESPYCTGAVPDQELNPLAEIDLSCFRNIPREYRGIAERIGRPYLAGPKGLDLDRAEELGIRLETLMDEIKRSGVSRRSVSLASWFIQRGECFSDPAFRMPGDLVFFQSGEFFPGAGEDLPMEMTVSHVGIISADRDQMINSSGYLERKRAEEENLPAVSAAPVFGKRQPAFFARPAYKKSRASARE